MQEGAHVRVQDERLLSMNYFMGLEVWQRSDEIFFSQGKYTVDVLRRFGMMDCKSMGTPMVSNLKKLHDRASGIDLVDPAMYKQLIGSLLYLVHMRLDIGYAVSALSQFMSKSRHALGSSETCAQISLWHSWLWTQTHFRWRCEVFRLYRFRLGRRCSGPKEYIRILFQHGFSHDFLVQQETKFYGIEYRRSRVYCC